MAFSKVTLNGTTLMDVTGDTVDSDNLLLNETATRADGTAVTGSMAKIETDTLTSPDLDLLNYNFCGYVTGATNTPYSTPPSGYVQNIVRARDSGYILQYFTYYSDDQYIYYRKKNNGIWGRWRPIFAKYGKGDTFLYSQNTNYAGIINGGYIYVAAALPKDPTVSSITPAFASGGGLIIRQNGHYLCGSGSSTYVTPNSMDVNRIEAETIQMRFNFGTTLTNDQNYVDLSVAGVQIHSLNLTLA